VSLFFLDESGTNILTPDNKLFSAKQERRRKKLRLNSQSVKTDDWEVDWVSSLFVRPDLLWWMTMCNSVAKNNNISILK